MDLAHRPNLAIWIAVALGLGMTAASTATPAAASAGTITVTTTADGSSSDAGIDCEPGSGLDCTLRAAIEIAGDGDTVVLDAGTHELDDQVVIKRAITLRGAGRGDTTIVATGDHRHLRIEAGTTGTITIRDLTLLGGGGTDEAGSGGSILATGNAEAIFHRVTFDTNSAPVPNGQLGGAVMFDQWGGSITISDSKFTGNTSAGGGAIYLKQVAGSTAIVDSDFSDNSAGGSGGNSGGAILSVLSTGELSIERSTFTNNTAGGHGGAFSLQAAGDVSLSRLILSGNESTLGGGAIHLSNGTSLDVENSTFSGNSGPGSVVDVDGSTATVRFSTIAPHSDAFASSSSTLAVTDSAVMGVSGCGAIGTVTGSIADTASDPDCAASTADDLQVRSDVDSPLLLPLPTSPLVGAASGGCPDTDQRGTARGGDCTVGAVEVLGIICPADPFPRGEEIACDLDVAIPGSNTDVLAQMNPVVFDGNVPLSRGSGSFTFVIGDDDPGELIDIAAGGGLYSATYSVVPIEGGGSGGGDSDDGSGNGSDGGSDNGSDDGSDGGAGNDDGDGGRGDGDGGGSDTNGGGSTSATSTHSSGPTSGVELTELAVTGGRVPFLALLGLVLIASGAGLRRTAARGRG